MGEGHVAILVPMTVELRPLVSRLGVRRDGGRRSTTWLGRVGVTEVSVHLVGIGPSRSGPAAERILATHRPDRVVVYGIAGGLAPTTSVGDLVVPAEVIDATTGERFHTTSWATLDPAGSMVTTEGMWGAQRLAAHRDAGVTAVDMETSAAVAAAERCGVPWSAVRGISDLVREGLVDESTLALTRPDGTTDVVAALRLLGRRPGRMRPLMQMANGTRRATDVAADAVLTALRSST